MSMKVYVVANYEPFEGARAYEICTTRRIARQYAVQRFGEESKYKKIDEGTPPAYGGWVIEEVEVQEVFVPWEVKLGPRSQRRRRH